MSASGWVSLRETNEKFCSEFTRLPAEPRLHEYAGGEGADEAVTERDSSLARPRGIMSSSGTREAAVSACPVADVKLKEEEAWVDETVLRRWWMFIEELLLRECESE